MAVLEAVFCHISRCSPAVEDALNSLTNKRKFGPKVLAALELLKSSDERESTQALTSIGIFRTNNMREHEQEFLNSFVEALAFPKEHIRALHGWCMGDRFIYGSLQFDLSPDPHIHVAVSEGAYFYAITAMLSILEAATNGRMTPYNLWLLVLSRGHLEGNYGIQNHHDGINGVDYGALLNRYLCHDAWLFGEYTLQDIQMLEYRETSEEIAELLRSAGFWMWMRPDRFPIEGPLPPREQPVAFSVTSPLAPPENRLRLSEMHLDVLYTIFSYLSLSDIVSVASTSKRLHYQLLGTLDARDTIANGYMNSRAQWCLPHGEAELKWWNERNGDRALGWEYMRRCYVESHSLRNRRRIWRAAESIEEEFNKEKLKWAKKYGVYL